MTDELLKRVERLERQNKRMKLALAALCLCLGALLTMGQTRAQKTNYGTERIEAREIVLDDGVVRAKLTPGSLVFSGTPGRIVEKATFSASGISLSGQYVTEIKPTGLICSRYGVPRFDLSIGEIGAALAFKNQAGLTGTMMDESTMVLMNNIGILSMRPEHLYLQKGEADAFLTPTSIKIRDTDRYKAILGQADLTAPKTGDKLSRSAASLTLLSKDDTVLWQAP